MSSGNVLRVLMLVMTVMTLCLVAGCRWGGGSSAKPPSSLSYPTPPAYTVGVAISALTPTVSGTASSYSVAPALPAGLSINASSGQISGTPSAAAATASYTVTASNAKGSTTAVLSITVNAATTPPPPAPSALSYQSPQSFTAGTAITPLNPTVTGTVASYAVAPSLPTGLTLNTTSGQVSGTPSAVAAQATYTITATNATGSTMFGLVITVNALPAITTQPQDQSVVAPATASFTVVASGTPAPTLQWQLSTDGGGTWTDIAGATAASYVTSATSVSDSGLRYRAVATNVAGNVTSSAASLTVTSAPTSQSWRTAELIEISSGNAVDPHIAVNAAGDALAVWSQQFGGYSRIYANRYTIADGWGAAVLVDSSTDGSYNPHIAIDAAGNAIAVWDQRDEVQNTWNIWANRYVAGTGWGTATTLESDLGRAEYPRVAMDANGNAIAVWWQQNIAGTVSTAIANRYVVGTGWGGAVALETANGFSNPLDVAMNATGTAVVVWIWGDGTAAEIRGNRFTPLGGWDGMVTISTDSIVAQRPAVVVDAAGNAMVAWDHNGAGFDSVYSSRYVAGSGWGAVELVEFDDSNSARNVRLAADSNGTVFAVWEQLFTTVFDIMANRYVPGVGWGTPAPLEAENLGHARDAQIAIGGDDSAVVVWSQRNNGAFTDFAWSNRYVPGSGWGTAEKIWGLDSRAYAPQIGMDANGNAVAVWQDQVQDGVSPTNIWSNVFQ